MEEETAAAAAPAVAEEPIASEGVKSESNDVQATPDPAAEKAESAVVTAESSKENSTDEKEGVAVKNEGDVNDDEKKGEGDASGDEKMGEADTTVDEKTGEEKSESPTLKAKKPKKETTLLKNKGDAIEDEKMGEADTTVDEKTGEEKSESPTPVKAKKPKKETTLLKNKGDTIEDEKMDEASSNVDEKAGKEKNETSTPVKAKKPKKEKITPPSPARTSGREQRVRKSIDAYDPTDVKEKKEILIPEGNGEKLGDMPRVVANFKDVTWSDPHLKMLHTIVFGRGQKKDFKSHLLQFNGLVYPEGQEEEEREKLKLKMYKLVLGDLKEVMDLCDIDRSAESFGKKAAPDKEMLCDRFLEWLENPKGSGKKVKAAKGKTTPSKNSPAVKGKTTPSKNSPAAKGKTTPSKNSPAAKGKTTPSKNSPAAKDSAKKRGRPKGSTKKETPPAKKAKGAVKAEVVEEDVGDEIDFNIPGTTIDRVREKVKSIVENANREELTVKGVRKILEEWLDTDLSNYKDAVRSLVMEAM